MKKGLQTLHNKKLMLEALENNLGIVEASRKQVGISRQTHYDWMEKDKDYAAKVQSIRQIVVDFGESKLYENVKKGDVTSIIFLLKTLGKSRGYVERQEIIHDAKISSKVIECKEIKQK